MSYDSRNNWRGNSWFWLRSKIQSKRPKLKIAILRKPEDQLANIKTGNNSGVIHFRSVLQAQDR